MEKSKLNEGTEKPSLFYKNPSSQSLFLARFTLSRGTRDLDLLTLILFLAFSFRFVYFIIFKEEENKVPPRDSIYLFSILFSSWTYICCCCCFYWVPAGYECFCFCCLDVCLISNQMACPLASCHDDKSF